MSHQAEDRIISVLDAMQDGIYIIGQDFVVEYMNQAMRENLAAHEGTKCFEIINGRSEICPWCRAREVFEDGATVRWEFHTKDPNRVYEVTELPLAMPGGRRSKLSIFRDLTPYRLQAERLQVTEQDFARLFETVDCGVYISSKEGRFLDANRALLSMMRYDSKEEFLHLDIEKDVYQDPGDRARFREMIERDSRVVDYEVDFKRRDGTPIHVLLTSHVRRDPSGKILGYEGIIVDQTPRMRLAAKLREANDFLQKLIASSPNAIMAADMKGNILIWNRAAEEILGYRAEEVIQKMNIVQIWPEGMAHQIMKMLRSDDHGGPGRVRSFPFTAKRRDGGVLESNFSAAILYDEQGRETATVGIMVDLKERLDMERRLRETQEQLLQSEKLAAMGRLTSQVAHEVNNPLYGIMNTLELLKTEVPPESKRRRILEMALSETVRLSTLLRKMLTFSKPDQEERQATNINTVMDEILMLHEKRLRENDISVETEFDPDLPPVRASKNQLRQVFLNLVANAHDAMPDGGVLTVATWPEDKIVVMEIADNGMGMRPEIQEKIFDAFFTTKGAVKGVGLGLSVCYGFIKEHGGDITVES
ncbi:MAG: PAS domain S-box protein, partial [Proteobacteria bacterium]|nr:PAS domain S-box protein [Pseudomonadota bacterium]